MKRGSICAILLSFMLLCTACSSGRNNAPMATESDSYASRSPATAEFAAEGDTVSFSAQAPSEANNSNSTFTPEAMTDGDIRKIIYNADLSITADDPAATLETLTQQALALGGYISSSRTSIEDNGTPRSNATLKVPADKLEELVTKAEGLGKVVRYELYSDDISQSYYDIQARLKSAKAEEAQLLTLLNQCVTVEDILSVRDSLAQVRSDIESYQGQINLWDNLTAYATLSVTIQPTPKTAVEDENELLTLWKASDVWNKMSRGFVNSARFMVNAVGAIGIFLAVSIIPAGILFLCIGLPILLHKKKKLKRNQAQAKASHSNAPLENAGEADAAQTLPKNE